MYLVIQQYEKTIAAIKHNEEDPAKVGNHDEKTLAFAERLANLLATDGLMEDGYCDVLFSHDPDPIGPDRDLAITDAAIICV